MRNNFKRENKKLIKESDAGLDSEKMKNYDLFLNICLFATFLFSILLTFLLIKSSTNFESNYTGYDSTTKKQMADIYQPEKLIYNTDDKHKIIQSYPGTVKNKILDCLIASRMDSLTKTKVSADEILDVLNTEDAMVYQYADIIPMDLFATRTQQTKLENSNIEFNYVVIPLNSSNKIYALNTITKDKIILSAKSLNYEKLKFYMKELNEVAKNQLSIDYTWLKDRIILSTPNKFKLPIYTYTISKSDPINYVAALLGNQTQVTEKEISDDEYEYTNVQTEQSIIYNSANERISYTEKKKPTNTLNTLQNRLIASFLQLRLINDDNSHVKYFSNKDRGKEIVYRSYVDIWPIFYQSEVGYDQFIYDKYDRVTMNTSLNSLNVPIPNSEEKELDSTNDIIKKLKKAKKLNKVVSLRIGYEWLKENTQDNSVINLKPVWVAELTNGKWEKVSSLLDLDE